MWYMFALLPFAVTVPVALASAFAQTARRCFSFATVRRSSAGDVCSATLVRATLNNGTSLSHDFGKKAGTAVMQLVFATLCSLVVSRPSGCAGCQDPLLIDLL